MRLIGIKVDSSQSEGSVTKNLKQEWFPFWGGIGDFGEKGLTDEEFLTEIKKTLSPTTFHHNLTSSSPTINIHAIVGKNGSGKSTILELLFRIVNNFAHKTVGAERNDLLAADGVNASLFYSLTNDKNEEQFYCISCRWAANKMEVKILEHGEGWVSLDDPRPRYAKHREVLKRFFYTIAVNYSHYAFNVNEVYSVDKSGDHWLNGLFHKNDGYLAPIVLNPMRTKGNFDVNRERNLSRQRLCGVLTLTPDLLENYTAKELRFEFLLKPFEDKLKKYLNEYWFDKKKKGQAEGDYVALLLKLYGEWAQKLGVERVLKNTNGTLTGLYRQFQFIVDIELHSTLLYLAYKTISISRRYSSFKSALKNDPIERMLQDQSHITLKIRQALHHVTRLETVLVRRYSYTIDEFKKQQGVREDSLDSIFEWMYPGNYQADIVLAKKDDSSQVQLSEMSSGERQLLYSLSSILYHLINLQSVPDDDDARHHYDNVNIILDEVEMYYHPEYQRQFVSKLISLIEGLKLDPKKVRAINICIVTHSPFLLSDIPCESILFLEDGRTVEGGGETFGANIYDILKNGFFLKKSVGEFFIKKLGALVNDIKTHVKEKNEYSVQEYKDKSVLIDRIGESFLREKLQSMLDELLPMHIALDEEIVRREKELDNLKKRKEGKK